jgi:hypothetical protein
MSPVIDRAKRIRLIDRFHPQRPNNVIAIRDVGFRVAEFR